MSDREQKMPTVVVWGAGNNCKTVVAAIHKDKCSLKGIADSRIELHGKKHMDRWMINAPGQLIDKDTDYVVISPYYSEPILEQCKAMGIDRDRVIDYWKSNTEYDFIDANVKKICELEREIGKLKIRIHNMLYELGLKPGPIIRPAEELLEVLIKEKKSLSRYGDGELEIMQKRERPWFQNTDEKLAKRLQDVFCCEDERIMIALSDNFGNLDSYTEVAADAIRLYLADGIREKLMRSIDSNRVYYDAYVTRPYMMYRDKQYAERIFSLFKRLWKNREILLVEGRYAYSGIRNDLFAGAADVRRIIAPAKNAFSVYDEILEIAERYAGKNTLALISLGPTATVLAYDLAMRGIQAVDIGQLDNEYEWYLRGVDERTEIPGKCVAESLAYQVPDEIADSSYERQIVARVGV